jgi:hypothetical protein
MKLTHIAFAALALATGTTAFAAPAAANQVYLAGASASAISVIHGLKNLCGANTFALYKQSSSLSSPGNIWSATCSASFTGTATNEVRFNNGGGSLSAVTTATAGGATSTTLLNPAAATCTNLAAGTGAMSFLAAGEMKNCGTTGTSPETTSGGFMDVDGTVFRANGLTIPASVNDATDYVPSNFQQAFGAGVSPTLYAALQSYQVATGQLPSTCAGAAPTYTASNLTTPACQPSLSRAQIASYMSGAPNARTAGVSMLFGGTSAVKTDFAAWTGAPNAGTSVTYCRRPNTSGTQASAQLYFLNSPTGTGELGGALPVQGSNTVPVSPATSTLVTQLKIVFDTRTGTGDVKTCMNTATGYAFGLLSMENNPIGGSDIHRLVKINGVSPTEGASATDSNTVEAIRGNYDFVYNTAMYCPGGACAPILTAVNAGVVAGNGSPGIFLTSEAKFLRGSNKPTRPLVLK